jgi:hypothetical protein
MNITDKALQKRKAMIRATLGETASEVPLFHLTQTIHQIKVYALILRTLALTPGTLSITDIYHILKAEHKVNPSMGFRACERVFSLPDVDTIGYDIRNMVNFGYLEEDPDATTQIADKESKKYDLTMRGHIAAWSMDYVQWNIAKYVQIYKADEGKYALLNPGVDVLVKYGCFKTLGKMCDELASFVLTRYNYIDRQPNETFPDSYNPLARNYFESLTDDKICSLLEDLSFTGLSRIMNDVQRGYSNGPIHEEMARLKKAVDNGEKDAKTLMDSCRRFMAKRALDVYQQYADPISTIP